MAARKKTEEQRLRILLKNISKNDMEQARELASNIIDMEDKLKETRSKIWTMDVVIPYNNGGGQTGLRENPAYKAYSSLLSSYLKAIKQLAEMRIEEKATAKGIFDWNK